MKHLSSFTQHNEGTQIAGRAWKGGQGDHYYRGKNLELKKEALFHLFRDVIGKQMGFKMMTGNQQKTPLQYVLLEVTHDEKNLRLKDEKHFYFHFSAEEGVENAAPFAPNKRDIVLVYKVLADRFMTEEDYDTTPRMNRKLANFLVKSANKLREMLVTANPIKKETGVEVGDKFIQKVAPSEQGWKDYDNMKSLSAAKPRFELDTEEIESFKKSKLKWSDFRCFDDNEAEFSMR